MPEFQKKVLLAVLHLLERPSGPVLEDFPEEAPLPPRRNGVVQEFPVRHFALDKAPDEILVRIVEEEIGILNPLYEARRARRGRTSTIEFSPEKAFRILHGIAAGNHRDMPAETIRMAAFDLKSFYYEGATDDLSDRNAADIWFWSETAAGETLRRLREYCIASDDPLLKSVAGAFVPHERL